MNEPFVCSDSGAAVTELALNRRYPLALAGLCRSGMYVADGIAPKIIGKLREGGFIKAFCDKGRFSSLLGKTPVQHGRLKGCIVTGLAGFPLLRE